MRAVNLIPAEQRRGAGGVAGRAGGAVYVLLAGLAVLVVMSVLYAVSASQVTDRTTKLAQVNAQADAVQSQAGALQPYVTFAGIRQSREQAVATLAAKRFDWAASMDQIARALPNDVTLSALTGGPPAATPATPGAVPQVAGGPSVALTGCASTHSEVAGVLVSLHRIVGVNSVSLATSQKGSGGSAPTGAAGCPGASFTANLAYAAAAAASTSTPNPTTGVTASTATSPTAGSIR